MVLRAAPENQMVLRWNSTAAVLMAKIATRARAKSRERSKDPKMDWVCLLVSYRPLAQQIVDRI